jgi:hypothetical protein
MGQNKLSVIFLVFIKELESVNISTILFDTYLFSISEYFFVCMEGQVDGMFVMGTLQEYEFPLKLKLSALRNLW